MSDVKRYFVGEHRMEADPNGDYVDHSDYEALERENAELREKALRVVRGEFGLICIGCGWESHEGGRFWEQLHAHISECPNHPIAALLARITTLEREKEEARDKALEEAVDAIDPKAVGTTCS